MKGLKYMIKMNNKMQLLLDKIKNCNNIEVNINKLNELLFPKIAKVHDCFIIDNECEMNENEVKFDFIKKMFGNRTMYEIGCNEVCINYYVESDDNLYAAQLGIIALEAWKYRLRAEYPSDEFCIVMEVSDTNTILRFYKIREEDGLIIGSNIERNTEIAILVEII